MSCWRRGFFEKVIRISEYMWKAFDGLIKRHPKVFTGHRGKGMMQGLVCGPLNTDVVKALREEKTARFSCWRKCRAFCAAFNNYRTTHR